MQVHFKITMIGYMISYQIGCNTSLDIKVYSSIFMMKKVVYIRKKIFKFLKIYLENIIVMIKILQMKTLILFCKLL